MPRPSIRYGPLARKTATVLLTLWLALGAVTAAAAASPGCDGSCCRSLIASTQLRASQRHCCSEQNPSLCHFGLPDAAAEKPAAVSPNPPEPGRNFPPVSGMTAAAAAGPGRYARLLAALLGGIQPKIPLFLRNQSLRR